MATFIPEELVADAMQPVIELDVPPVLMASVERQSRNLLGLASSLLRSGMNEEQVRAVIDQAYSSYRDELVSTIFSLRDRDEIQSKAAR